MGELLPLLRGVVQDSDEQLGIFNEIRSRFFPPCFTVLHVVSNSCMKDSGPDETPPVEATRAPFGRR